MASDLLGLPDSEPAAPDLESAPSVFDALHRAIQHGLVEACHDLSDGGLIAAAAEMMIGSSGLGAHLDPMRAPADASQGMLSRLFSECPTRFLVEVAPVHLEAFALLFRTLPWATIGEVTADGHLSVRGAQGAVLRLSRAALASASGVPAATAPESFP